MGRKRTPGLYKRRGIWHIDKTVFGRRLCDSTGTGDLEEAEKYLARHLEEMRQAVVYGVRPKRTFQEAATKFLMENPHKRSLHSDASRLKGLVEYIGNMSLDSIHMGSLQPFIEGRRSARITTHYSSAELQNLYEAANKACEQQQSGVVLTLLRRSDVTPAGAEQQDTQQVML